MNKKLLLIPAAIALCIGLVILLRQSSRETIAEYVPAYAHTPVYEYTPQEIELAEPIEAYEPPPPRISFTEASESLQNQGYATVGLTYFAYGRPMRFNIAYDACSQAAEDTIEHMADTFASLYYILPGFRMATFFMEADIDNANVRRRYIYHDFSQDFHGLATYLFFMQPHRYALPAWLASGIEDYVNNSGTQIDDLAAWLTTNACPTRPLFGDAFFIPSFNLYPNHDTVRAVAYTIVRQLSDAGELWDWVDLAQSDRYEFTTQSNAFFEELSGVSHENAKDFFYHFGTFEIWTEHGQYFYVWHGYDWPWEQVQRYNEYMDFSIQFVREWLDWHEPERVKVELNPFNGQNSEYIMTFLLAERWDEALVDYGNFGGANLAIVTHARDGLWALTHEVIHAIHSLKNAAAPTWVIEGLAMAGEAVFRQRYYEFVRSLDVYDFDMVTTPEWLRLYTLVAASHPFFFVRGTEQTFGKYEWGYEDSGSFVLFLYENFDHEQFLYYVANTGIWNQVDVFYRTFGTTIEEALYEWRNYLWPCGEPDGWWEYNHFDGDLFYGIDMLSDIYICDCWYFLPGLLQLFDEMGW